MFGAQALGAAILVFVAVTLLVGVAEATRRRPMLATTALLLQASLPVGLVAASVQLVTRYEIGAVVILLAIGMGFDLGDFLIGSGAGSLIEGPMAGGWSWHSWSPSPRSSRRPPSTVRSSGASGSSRSSLCPLGQVIASWLLPDATTRAGALRRLDSLLLLAPAGRSLAGIVSAHA